VKGLTPGGGLREKVGFSGRRQVGGKYIRERAADKEARQVQLGGSVLDSLVKKKCDSPCQKKEGPEARTTEGSRFGGEKNVSYRGLPLRVKKSTPIKSRRGGILLFLKGERVSDPTA